MTCENNLSCDCTEILVPKISENYYNDNEIVITKN